MLGCRRPDGRSRSITGSQRGQRGGPPPGPVSTRRPHDLLVVLRLRSAFPPTASSSVRVPRPCERQAFRRGALYDSRIISDTRGGKTKSTSRRLRSPRSDTEERRRPRGTLPHSLTKRPPPPPAPRAALRQRRGSLSISRLVSSPPPLAQVITRVRYVVNQHVSRRTSIPAAQWRIGMFGESLCLRVCVCVCV